MEFKFLNLHSSLYLPTSCPFMPLLCLLSTLQYQKVYISPPVELNGLPERDTKDPAALCGAKEGWNQGNYLSIVPGTGR